MTGIRVILVPRGNEQRDSKKRLDVGMKNLTFVVCEGGSEPGNDARKRTLPFPCPESPRHQWLSESETIINTKRSLLFCAPPNAGSLQFRMLAKRMEV